MAQSMRDMRVKLLAVTIAALVWLVLGLVMAVGLFFQFGFFSPIWATTCASIFRICLSVAAGIIIYRAVGIIIYRLEMGKPLLPWRS